MNRVPEIVLPKRIDLPQVGLCRAKNGVALHPIDVCAESGVVRLSVVFEAGSRAQSKPFQAMATVSLLSEGAGGWSAVEMAERFDFYGVYFNATVDRDSAIFTVAAATEFLPQALELLGALLSAPAFDPIELERYVAKKREQLLVEHQKPSFVVRRAFVGALFGSEHPYGRVSEPGELDSLTVADLKAFWSQFLVAERCFAVASGAVNGVEEQLLALLAQIPSWGKPLGELPSAAPVVRPAVVERVVRAEAAQTSIRAGRLTVGRDHPDFIPLQVASMILGGYFSSRLMQRLREELGLTYGAYASVAVLEQAAYVAVSTEVNGEKGTEAIEAIKMELNRLRTELVPQEELDMVRSVATGEVMRLVDGPFGWADAVIENVQSGLPDDYVNQFLERVASVTPQEVQDMANNYFNPHDWSWVEVSKFGANGMEHEA